ncbi:MAG: hypothetical protein HC890_10335 [Chloroflexaceae bacterium]|nr:hypothetical protein [Chloroflexaceae bacterium]
MQPPQCQKILLAELFEDLEDSTHLLLANRNYHLHILPAADIWVWGDRNWLQQALLMLVDTAIVYGQTEHMTLTVAVNESQAIVDLDLGCPQTAWSEPKDLLGQDPPPSDLRPLAQRWDFSPGMKLLLAQHLLEAMNAQLAIVEPDNPETSPALTRLRLCLPLA